MIACLLLKELAVYKEDIYFTDNLLITQVEQ
jgi:hypothetical protein